MIKQALVVAAVLLSCTACSKIDKKYGAFTPDRNGAYLKEHETAPLKLPPGYALDERESTDHFPLPRGQRPEPGAAPVSIIPPTLTSALGAPSDAAS